MKNRKGFSLVELLIVILNVSALVGLLLPAVQQAAQTARKASYSNNLKHQELPLHMSLDQRGETLKN
tara:strand:+ start:260 stop:460 length:201 start_codon:yes stop_codon:yes gene_type:complete